MACIRSVKDAALALGVTVGTLANWRVRGCGPQFVRIGGKIGYRDEDLEAFIKAGIRTSTSQEVAA